jgi:parallel beta-helix repeat protein
MARRLITTSIVFLLGVFSISVANAGVQPVYDCETTLSEPGNYRLMNDLLDCAYYGVWIEGSDITLDLDGHSISCLDNGERNAGVIAWNTDSWFIRDVHVKNGHVSNCADGFLLAGAVDSKITKVSSFGNRIWYTPDGEEASGTGITVWYSENSLVKNNHTYDNAMQGIGVWDSAGTLIKHNTVTGNPFAGIWTASADGTEISCNRAHGNGTGIGLGPSSTGGLVKGNLATENWSDGISAWAWAWDGFPYTELPSENTFKHNISEANWGVDHAEALYDLLTGDIITHPDDMCRNTWFENQFYSSFGPDGCIGYRVELDEDDVCALDDDGDGD